MGKETIVVHYKYYHKSDSRNWGKPRRNSGLPISEAVRSGEKVGYSLAL